MKKQPFSTAIHELYRKALQHTKYRWLVIFGTLLYLVSPLDISPDVFPILGWIDDGVVVSLLVTEISQLMVQRLKDQRQTTTSATTSFTTPLDADDTTPTITVEAISVG
ncbi:MAG: YkvA family protein [Phormidesmis sp.]